MKLPDDKKQRTQVLALIGIGALAVLVGIYYGIGFVRDRTKAIAGKTEELKENIKKANLEIDLMSKDRKLNKETIQKIKGLSDKYLLKPRIGNNYHLAAKDILETEAQKVNLMTPEAALKISEIGHSDIDASFRSYTAHISLVCGYNDLIRFIRSIEESNPLWSIMNISITGRSAPNTGTHTVSFDVQWPVWVDQGMPLKLEAQIAAQDGGQEKR